MAGLRCGHDTRKCALNLDPYDTCTVWYPLAGTTHPRAPREWWHDPLSSKAWESHVASRSPGSGVLNSRPLLGVQPPGPLT